MESSGSLVGVFCQNIGKWESSEMCVESDSVDKGPPPKLSVIFLLGCAGIPVYVVVNDLR